MSLSRRPVRVPRNIGVSLEKYYMKHGHLRDFDLHGVDLIGLSLGGADMRGCNLEGAHITDTYLGEANLSGVNLKGAQLIRTDLSVANLNGADLSKVFAHELVLEKANLKGANLTDARLQESILSSADFTGAKMTGADLSGAEATRAIFHECMISGADISGSDMTGSKFTRAKMDDVDASGTTFNGANFTDAVITGSNLSHCDFERANFKGAWLSDSKFDGAKLRGAKLTGADMESNTSDYTTEWPKGMAPGLPEEHLKIQKPKSEEFRRWFGSSKVVDAKGRPLVVYHATASGGFTAFRPGDTGIYFTDNLSLVSTYLFYPTEHTDDPLRHPGEEVPGIFRSYLKIENPFMLDAKGGVWDGLVDPRLPKGVQTTSDISLYARKIGHDGVIVKRVVDAGTLSDYGAQEFASTIYVVFDPRQIKSAVVNDGKYDPNDPDMRKNPKGLRKGSAFRALRPHVR